MEEDIPEKKPVKQGLVFINNSNPDDARTKPKRRAVRSHAARYQPLLENQDRFPRITTKQNRYRRRQDAQNLSFPLEIEDFAKTIPSTQAGPSWRRPETHSLSQSVAEVEASVCSRSHKLGLSITATQPLRVQSHSLQRQIPRLIPRQNFNGWVPPIVAFPVPWKPFVPVVINHCELRFVC